LRKKQTPTEKETDRTSQPFFRSESVDIIAGGGGWLWGEKRAKFSPLAKGKEFGKKKKRREPIVKKHITGLPRKRRCVAEAGDEFNHWRSQGAKIRLSPQGTVAKEGGGTWSRRDKRGLGEKGRSEENVGKASAPLREKRKRVGHQGRGKGESRLLVTAGRYLREGVTLLRALLPSSKRRNKKEGGGSGGCFDQKKKRARKRALKPSP